MARPIVASNRGVQGSGMGSFGDYQLNRDLVMRG